MSNKCKVVHSIWGPKFTYWAFTYTFCRVENTSWRVEIVTRCESNLVALESSLVPGVQPSVMVACLQLPRRERSQAVRRKLHNCAKHSRNWGFPHSQASAVGVCKPSRDNLLHRSWIISSLSWTLGTGKGSITNLGFSPVSGSIPKVVAWMLPEAKTVTATQSLRSASPFIQEASKSRNAVWSQETCKRWKRFRHTI